MQKKITLRQSTKSNIGTLIMCVVLFAVMQILISFNLVGSSIQGMLVPMCIYIIMAVSLNLVVGFLGELSLGHAGFMCVGAYASSIFSLATAQTIQSNGLRFFLAIIVGGIFAAIFGIIIGIPVLRLRGDYLAIVTLAFGEIIKNLLNVLYIGVDDSGLHFSIKDTASLNLGEGGSVILKGAQGITGTPKSSTFTIAFILLLITLIVIMNLVDSRTGRAIMAVRDNRIAAESIGINITKYKLIAFSVSAFFAGIAGVLYSHYYGALQATTKNFGYNMSIMILVYVVLGRMGSLRGSIIATIILYALPELLRNNTISNYRMLIYAVILIVMMIVNNNSTILGYIENFKSKIFKKKKSEEVQA